MRFGEYENLEEAQREKVSDGGAGGRRRPKPSWWVRGSPVAWAAVVTLGFVSLVLATVVGYLVAGANDDGDAVPQSADGCLYTSQEIVDLTLQAEEFYGCVLFHSNALFASLSIDDLDDCYWDLGSNQTIQILASLKDRAEAAMLDSKTKSSEKIGLETIANDVSMALTLVEKGHYIAGTADPWRDYAWLPDWIIEGYYILSVITWGDMSAQEGYEDSVLRWLGSYSDAVLTWYSAMQKAAAEHKVHAKVVMDIQSPYYLEAYSANYTQICATFVTEAGKSQCVTQTSVINGDLARMLSFFQNSYLPACEAYRPDEKSGLVNIPDGLEVYQAWLDYHLGYAETALNIYEIGVQRVEDNRLNIVSTIQVIDPTILTFEEASISLSNANDSRWYICTNDVSYVINYVTLLKAEIEKYIIPDFEYFPGIRADVTVDGGPSTYSSPGVYDHEYNFWVSPAAYNVGQMEYCYTENGTQAYYYERNVISTVAHEASPGHAHQLAIGAEVDCPLGGGYSSGSTLFIEGWALYSETELYSMGNSDFGPKGLYEDPYNELSFYTAQMLRNVRLVVDPAMHGDISPYPNFSWSDCVEFMVNNSFSLYLAQSECERYLQMPGQATSYMLGNIKMLELRKYAEQLMGALFVPAQYHNLVLRWNAMSYDQLHSLVDTWVLSTLDPTNETLSTMFGYDLITEEMFSRTRPTVGLGRAKVNETNSNSAGSKQKVSSHGSQAKKSPSQTKLLLTLNMDRHSHLAVGDLAKPCTTKITKK
ncbi:DUF885 family protein [Pelomyxa schiedti]|nr:DUF885 family protein [Pelomyxa schiedti]